MCMTVVGVWIVPMAVRHRRMGGCVSVTRPSNLRPRLPVASDRNGQWLPNHALRRAPGQHWFLRRPILETSRKLFRYADVEGATALSVRHTVVARLYDRGADEEQIGLVLGIGDRSAVRGMFPRARQTMAQLVDELI